MEKRILHLNDLHLRERPFSTIKNYVEILEEKLELLIKLKSDLDLYGIIINGDLADCGYQDKIMKSSHMNYITELGRGLKVFALNIGNHFFIERDANIELFLIQPSSNYPMRKKHFAVSPILHTPNEVIVDKVQFSLFNFDRNNKNYINERKENIEYHIGLYHDEVVVPRNVRIDMNIPISITSEYLKKIFFNIDEAICAHIHKPFPLQHIMLDNKHILLRIPGSFSITEHSSTETHLYTEMPLYSINGSNLSTELIKFPTLIQKLDFVVNSKIDIENEIIEPVFVTDVTTNVNTIKYNLNSKKSLIQYLNDKGYDNNSLEVIKQAITKELSRDTALKLFLTRKGGEL